MVGNLLLGLDSMGALALVRFANSAKCGTASLLACLLV